MPGIPAKLLRFDRTQRNRRCALVARPSVELCESRTLLSGSPPPVIDLTVGDHSGIDVQSRGGGLISLAGTSTSITFSATVPNSVFRSVTVPANTSADVQIFARDGFIRDDVVVIFINGSQLASVDSRGGSSGTHAGETHTISVGPGTHTIEYRLMADNVGPSGWEVSETVLPGTGKYPLGGVYYVEPLVNMPTIVPLYTKPETIWSISDDVGYRIDVMIVPADWLGLGLTARYEAILTFPTGQRVLVGRCVWWPGKNEFFVFHTGDVAPKNGKPDSFTSSKWTSYALLNEEGGQETWDYDFFSPAFASRSLSLATALPGQRTVGLYDFSSKPYLKFLDQGPPSLTDPSPIPWPRIDEVVPNATNGPSDRLRCDLDLNGSCDSHDWEIFKGAYDTRRGDESYHPLADFDGDGTVNATDEALLGFTGPVSVSSLTKVTFSGIVHDPRRKQSRTLAAVTNASEGMIMSPLILVIRAISDPFVTLDTFDGVTSDGKPYVNITGAVPGLTLDPGEVTQAIPLIFNNPLSRRFSVDAEVRSDIAGTMLPWRQSPTVSFAQSPYQRIQAPMSKFSPEMVSFGMTSPSSSMAPTWPGDAHHRVPLDGRQRGPVGLGSLRNRPPRHGQIPPGRSVLHRAIG